MPDIHGAIHLGAHGEDAPDFDALSDQEQADLAALAQVTDTAAPPAGRPVVAMFLVVIPENGQALAIRDIAEASQFCGRPATLDEIACACRTVEQEILMNKAAQIQVMRQMQTAAAVQQQLESQRIAAELAHGYGFPPNARPSGPFTRPR